jgi:transposase InsO family protein
MREYHDYISSLLHGKSGKGNEEELHKDPTASIASMHVCTLAEEVDETEISHVLEEASSLHDRELNEVLLEEVAVIQGKTNIARLYKRPAFSLHIQISPQTIREEQHKSFSEILDKLKLVPEISTNRKNKKSFVLIDGILLGLKDNETKQVKIYCNEKLTLNIMAAIHLLGHMSWNRILEEFSTFYDGKNKTYFAKLIPASCRTCLLRVLPRAKDFADGHINRYSRPLETVAIDFMRMTEHGNECKYILNIVCVYSHYTLAAITADESTREVLKAMKSVFEHFPQIRHVMSDNGPSFTSKQFLDFMKDNKVEHILTTPYSSKSNSIVETGNKLLRNSILRCMVAFKDEKWTSSFNVAKLLVNSLKRTYARGTEHEFTATAFELVYGHDPSRDFNQIARFHQLPTTELLKERELLQSKLIKYLQELDEDLKKKDEETEEKVNVGDLVLVRDMKSDKNSSIRYQRDLFKVINRKYRTLYVMSLYKGHRIHMVHAKHVKKFEPVQIMALLTPEIRERLGGYPESRRLESTKFRFSI